MGNMNKGRHTSYMKVIKCWKIHVYKLVKPLSTFELEPAEHVLRAKYMYGPRPSGLGETDGLQGSSAHAH